MSTNNDGWILMSERKPTMADLPVLLETRLSINGGQYFVVAHSMESVDGMAACGNYERWMRIPAPPREKTQEEKDRIAWANWWHHGSQTTDALLTWHAALAYERAEVGKMLPDFRPTAFPPAAIDAIEAIRARCGGGK